MTADNPVRRPKPKKAATAKGASLPKSTRGQTYDNRAHVVSVRNLIVGDSDELSLVELRQELQDMRNVLLGRVPPPIDTGISTLMEVAEVYHSRAKEIEQVFHQEENNGNIMKGTSHYKFRTGELRSFIEMCKGAMELGSRRVTSLKMELEMEG